MLFRLFLLTLATLCLALPTMADTATDQTSPSDSDESLAPYWPIQWSGGSCVYGGGIYTAIQAGNYAIPPFTWGGAFIQYNVDGSWVTRPTTDSTRVKFMVDKRFASTAPSATLSLSYLEYSIMPPYDTTYVTYELTIPICQVMCGDLNNNDLVTMADLTILNDHLFISLTPLTYRQAGNVDGSQDGLVTMGDMTRLIDYLFISLDPDLLNCR